MSQRPPHDPDTAASRRPGARDGRQALARQQQRLQLLAHRAAPIQFSLPIDWSGLYDRRKRQHQHCREYFLHVWSSVSKGHDRDPNLVPAPQGQSHDARRKSIHCSQAFLPWRPDLSTRPKIKGSSLRTVNSASALSLDLLLPKRFSLLSFPLLDDPQPRKTGGEDYHDDQDGVFDHGSALS
jgi:hypothetical protein